MYYLECARLRSLCVARDRNRTAKAICMASTTKLYEHLNAVISCCQNKKKPSLKTENTLQQMITNMTEARLKCLVPSETFNNRKQSLFFFPLSKLNSNIVTVLLCCFLRDPC